MPDDEKPCPACGCVHDFPFSPEVMQYYLEYQHCSDSEERTICAMRLAEEYYGDHDFTSINPSESYHEFFENYEKARLEYEQASLRVARLAVKIIEEYHKTHDFPSESQPTSVVN